MASTKENGSETPLSRADDASEVRHHHIHDNETSTLTTYISLILYSPAHRRRQKSHNTLHPHSRRSLCPPRQCFPACPTHYQRPHRLTTAPPTKPNHPLRSSSARRRKQARPRQRRPPPNHLPDPQPQRKHLGPRLPRQTLLRPDPRRPSLRTPPRHPKHKRPRLLRLPGPHRLRKTHRQPPRQLIRLPRKIRRRHYMRRR